MSVNESGRPDREEAHRQAEDRAAAAVMEWHASLGSDLMTTEHYVREQTRVVLSALLESSRVPCETCHNNAPIAWCEFDGTGEGCTRVTEFTGGHASGVVRWKTTTYEGGWIGDEEFSPGDTILRRTDGSYSVGSYKAWSQRLVKMLGCPDCDGGFVVSAPLAVLTADLEGEGGYTEAQCVDAVEASLTDHYFTKVVPAEDRAEQAEAALDAIEAMLTKKKRMGTLFDVQQIRASAVRAPLPESETPA